MADTVFTWNVAQMERQTADGIVFTVHYTVDAKTTPTPQAPTAAWDWSSPKATSSPTPT